VTHLGLDDARSLSECDAASEHFSPTYVFILLHFTVAYMFGKAEAILVKFCTQLGYVKSQHTDDKMTHKRTLKRGAIRVT